MDSPIHPLSPQTPPAAMGPEEVAAFLSHLAVHDVSASTQNQALCALLFLYRRRAPETARPARARATPGGRSCASGPDPRRGPAPSFAAAARARRGWSSHSCTGGAAAQECLQLRVKDLDFERRQIVLRRAKGQKDRTRSAAGDAVQPAPGEHLNAVRASTRAT